MAKAFDGRPSILAKQARDTGISRYLAQDAPDVELVLADPVGSVLSPRCQSAVCDLCRG